MFCFFPSGVCVGTLNLIASTPGPSIHTLIGSFYFIRYYLSNSRIISQQQGAGNLLLRTKYLEKHPN